jgi:hypothetical protein
MVRVKLSDTNQIEGLMSAEQYREMVGA